MDPNVFALIIAKDWFSSDAIRDERNRIRFVDKNKDIQGEEHNVRRLELRFDRNLPKSQNQKWHFGTSTQLSDVLIFPTARPEVAHTQHFSLSITPKFRIELHQLSPNNVVRLTYRLDETGDKSPSGLSVTTNTFDYTPRPRDSIIIRRAPWEEQIWVRVEICVVDRVTDESAMYEIVFPNHTQNTTDAYRDILKKWIGGDAAQDSDSEGDLVSTTTTSISQTPIDDIPVFRRSIGGGGYGTVQLWVDLRTGHTAAMKTLHKGLSAGNALDDFRSEIHLMKKLDHKYVNKMFRFELEPRPRFSMPYYRLGNIGEHHLRQDQYISAFQQLLEGIQYLHKSHVAHRDLKPENILVACLDPIHIVISDFGLSKLAVSTHMTSIVGTCWYRALDMFTCRDHDNKGYLFDAVDIWSAGVIMLKWVYKLPQYKSCTKGHEFEWTPGWIAAVVKELASCRQDQAVNDVDTRILDILDHMLVVDAESRYSADECLEMGYKSKLFTQLQSPGAIPISDNNSKADIHYSVTHIDTHKDKGSGNRTEVLQTEHNAKRQKSGNGRSLPARGPDGRFLKRGVSSAANRKSNSRFMRKSAQDLASLAVASVPLRRIAEET